MGFLYLGKHDEGLFLDLDFADTSRNRDKRQWRITYDRHRRGWYGYLLRAADEEAEFDHAVKLPDKILQHLIIEAARFLPPDYRRKREIDHEIEDWFDWFEATREASLNTIKGYLEK